MKEFDIYVPDLETYKCFVVQNNETIRAYKSIPVNNSDVAYRDYYINSHYIYKDGYQTFGNYGYNALPTCLDSSVLTSSIWYRNDFDSILMIFFLVVLIVYFIFKKVVRGFFLGLRYS